MDRKTHRRSPAPGAVALLAAAAMLGLATLACSSPGNGLLGESRRGAARGFNLLLVTLDTTRADHVGCYGAEWAETPVLDALAAEGVRFDDAVTVTPLTGPSHATILTGLYPPNHGLRANASYRLGEETETLAERLRENGYRTAAFVSSFVLNGRFGFGQGFESYDDRVTADGRAGVEVVVDRTATEVTDSAVDWLTRLDGDAPFFAWVHYFDPHLPYSAPRRFADRFPDRPYDAEIAYADSQLGRLVKTLEQKKMKERTLIVVVGDHGEALGDHGEASHGFFIYRPVTRVPLILHGPAVLPRSRVVDEVVVSVADIVPTLGELLGIDPSYTDGESLVTGGDDRDRRVYLESLNPYLDHGWSPLFGLRRHDDKYVRAPVAEYYDLRSDPSEETNLYDGVSGRGLVARDALVADLEELLAEWPPIGDVAEQAVTLDPDALERLRSLGYVGGASAPVGESLADPKEMLGLYLRFCEAQDLVAQGRPLEGMAMLETLAEESPDNRAALDHLARGYVMLGRYDRAESAVRRLLELRPDPDSLMLLAQVLIARRGFDEVDELIDQSLALDADHGMTIVVQGDLAAYRGSFDEAVEHYRRAAEVDPHEAGELVPSRLAWVSQLQSAGGRR